MRAEVSADSTRKQEPRKDGSPMAETPPRGEDLRGQVTVGNGNSSQLISR